MANRRMINKNDIESMFYGSLTLRQRYLFCGLMLYADDDGIMPIPLVQSRVFPFDGNSISLDEIIADLKKLEEINLIILYENDEYLQICNWWKRQFIDHRIYKQTTYPKPPKYRPRPKNLKKYCNDDDYSSNLLEQNREDEGSKDKTILEEGNNKKYKHSDGKHKPYPEFALD